MWCGGVCVIPASIPSAAGSSMVKLSVIVKTLSLVLVGLLLLCWVFYGGFPSSLDGDRTQSGIAWHSYMESSVRDPEYSAVNSQVKLPEYNAELAKKLPFNAFALPLESDWVRAEYKLSTFANATSDIGNRNVVIYTIEDIETNDVAADMVIDNVKIFVHDLHAVAPTSTFYLFMVCAGTASVAENLIPVHLANVALVRWTRRSSSIYTFMHTVRLLGADQLSKFGAVFSLGSGVRGPLAYGERSIWITEYRRLLDANNVGLVGPLVSCDPVPHVQLHMFGIRGAMVKPLLSDLERYFLRKKFISAQEYYRVRLSEITNWAGFNLASMLHAKRTGELVLGKTCTEPHRVRDDETCALDPSDVFFVRWGGGSWGEAGYPCSKGVSMDAVTRGRVKRLTDSILGSARSALMPAQSLASEVVAGGVLYDLYVEHAAEARRSQVVVAEKQAVPTSGEGKVCFLVRTSTMHDPEFDPTKGAGKMRFVEMNLDVLAKSLIMQTNPNWRAFFIITDPSPFETRLQKIIESYHDARLQYYDVALTHRPPFTRVDAGYTTTDYVLGKLLRTPECTWVSATNGDNAYGSEVVARILSAAPLPGTHKQPDMLLLPMDSRNFADQDVHKREDFAWDKRCVGIEAMAAFNQLIATAGSLPKIARLDLAAMVLSRSKLVTENVQFGNFSDITRFHCAGCNDGYFAQYLTRNRGWTYARLPVDGLRSIMFHGPSPTHCIAAGNVWFDHPDVGKVGCLSHEEVHRARVRDSRRKEAVRMYDWVHFNASDAICLRLSKHGHTYPDSAHRRLSVSQNGETPGFRLFANHSTDGVVRRQLREQQPGCDAKTYLALNPDLKGKVSESAALQHYKQHGQAEGRPCVFDWQGYITFNPDLPKRLRNPAKALQHYIDHGRAENRVFKSPPGFDWLAYVETNLDLYHAHIIERSSATQHYVTAGIKEGRNCHPVRASNSSWATALQKFTSYFSSTIPLAKRNLIIYHVEDIGSNDNAYDLTVNNLRLFVVALHHHTQTEGAELKAFYWFNVAALTDNPMKRLIPAHLSNVAVTDWVYSSSAFNSFIHTLQRLGTDTLSTVSAVVATSTGVRGPLHHYQGGKWLAEYRRVLDSHNVGLVGPVIDCHDAPHVQNHMFALRVEAVPAVLREMERYYQIARFVPIEDYFREHLTAAVTDAKFQVASLQDVRRNKASYFAGKCADSKDATVAMQCRIDPRDALFLRWSGESLGGKGFLCGKGIAMAAKNKLEVQQQTAEAWQALLHGTKSLPEQLMPVLPEAPTGWQIYEEYNTEASLHPTSPSTSTAVGGAREQEEAMCFVIRVDKLHDATPKKGQRPNEDVVKRSVQDLIRSLKVQTNPHWRAILTTADSTFVAGVLSIAAHAADSRIIAATLPVQSKSFLLDVTGRGGCTWVTTVPGDTIYGSDIVQRVLSSPKPVGSSDVADMVLLPTDSAVFARRDYAVRGDLTWDKRCRGLEAMISLYQTSYTAQPVPQPGRFLPSSVVFRRERLWAAGVMSSNSSFDYVSDAGRLVQHLVRTRRWSYARLAMDGLRSVVFDHPSPTLCVASGNVWLDHPCEQQARCVSHEAVLRWRGQAWGRIDFDWDRFYFLDQVCLRLSKKAFERQSACDT